MSGGAHLNALGLLVIRYRFHLPVACRQDKLNEAQRSRESGLLNGPKEPNTLSRVSLYGFNHGGMPWHKTKRARITIILDTSLEMWISMGTAIRRDRKRFLASIMIILATNLEIWISMAIEIRAAQARNNKK
ncbi:hypothetical protein [Rhodoplanes roseus]|uniref:hypothetical protein n=1 Tax=Rhodoplanes roseus TaxID=29409 RepID=UPI0011B38376|nr:hypothetical protein [Rhodoplanes roseus]